MKGATAILIFARSAQADAYAKGMQKQSKLFHCLNKRTEQLVKKTGLDYFVFSEKQQYGENFGERYCNAVEEVLALGYHSVITIGNDSPGLSFKLLQKAIENIKGNKISLGPSKDGGFYLLSINQSAYNREVFLSLPWKKASLCSALIKTLGQFSDITFLSVLQDLDQKADIPKLLSEIKKKLAELHRFLVNALSSTVPVYSRPKQYYFLPLSHDFYNKGSPLNC